MKVLTRDDTEHGKEYVLLAEALEAVAAERERCAQVVRYWLAGYAADTVASHEARCLAHILDGRQAPEGPNE